MRRLATTTIALALLSAACVQTRTADVPNEASMGDARAPRVAGATAAASDPATINLQFKLKASGLSSPVAIASPGDGTKRVFIVEQAGVIKIWDGTKIRGVPYLDIRGLVRSGGEEGLLGLAFHAKFKENRFFYVYYTDNSGDIRVARYRAGANHKDNTANAGSRKQIIRIPHPTYGNHNGGQLQFGGKYLFIATGDGGSGGDPAGNAQNKTSLLGKILRLDVDNSCGNNNYCKPSTNPFIGKPGKGEIWHYGLRNPWRFSIDRDNGAMWIADVGQDSHEEVNRVKKGAKGVNFGWDCKEGKSNFEAFRSYCQGANLKDPLRQYGHSGSRAAVVGGYVYRGSDDPELRGIYLYNDFGSNEVWGIGKVNGAWKKSYIEQSPANLSSWGERGEDGEIYAVTLAGNFYRIRAT